MRPPQDIPVGHIHPSPTSRPVKLGQVVVLAESIKQIGLRQPISVRPIAGGYEVRGGGHRLAAFRHLNRETIPAFVCDDDDLHAELAEIDENLIRNELSPAERAIAVSRRKAIYEALHPETAHGGARKSSRQVGDLIESEKPDGETQERFTKSTSEATGQSERSVQRDATRGEIGESALAKVIGTSLDKGEEIDALAKLSPQKRDEVIEKAAAGEKVSAKTEAKKEKRDGRERELGRKQFEALEPIYGCVLEDYEWDFEVYSRNTGMDRHAGNHYPTSTEAHAAEEIVKRTEERMRCAAADCVLGMWATVPHAAIAMEVMRLRGFEYKSQFAWVKDKAGTGYWNRNRHELFLIGTRGRVVAPAMGTQFDSVIAAPVGEHSVKPDWQYQFFERHFPSLPKIELNARRARPGWMAWGLDAPVIAAGEPITEIDPATCEVLNDAAPEAEPTENELEIPDFLRRAPAEALP